MQPGWLCYGRKWNGSTNGSASSTGDVREFGRRKKNCERCREEAIGGLCEYDFCASPVRLPMERQSRERERIPTDYQDDVTACEGTAARDCVLAQL